MSTLSDAIACGRQHSREHGSELTVNEVYLVVLANEVTLLRRKLEAALARADTR